MKVLKRCLAGAILGALLAGGCSKDEASPAASTWTISWSFADAGGTAALNKNAAKDGSFAALGSFNNKLFAAWVEDNGTANQLRVKSTSDGSNWSFVDGGGADGLNIDPTLEAKAPAFAATSSKVFLAWSEPDMSSVVAVRVKASADGATWTSVETAGINADNTQSALDVKLVVFNDEVYAFWSETSAGGTVIRGKKYGGSGTTWTSIDGGALNKDAAKDANNVYPIVYNDKLYVGWDEVGSNNKTQVRVKGYNGGTSWSFVDGDGALGLNHDTAQDAGGPKFAVFDSKLFMIFSESNGTKSQVRAKYFDGSNWTVADAGGTSGLNVNSAEGAGASALLSFNSRLFAFWQEDSATISQVRVKQYVGGATWTTADGGSTQGLNVSASQIAYVPAAQVFASKLYVIWHERVSSIWNIMVKAGS